ncbi:bacterial Ig-like domain-containing protein [Candidatus Enterococcus mansonii]|uniref:Gram-positive cocci surface proteins LPxTG domain-containing protein n=1 Tax=Candidatus Enterococcus mansonii TaxID=1834181 RepID=A0ABU8IG86_9ENTE
MKKNRILTCVTLAALLSQNILPLSAAAEVLEENVQTEDVTSSEVVESESSDSEQATTEETTETQIQQDSSESEDVPVEEENVVPHSRAVPAGMEITDELLQEIKIYNMTDNVGTEYNTNGINRIENGAAVKLQLDFNQVGTYHSGDTYTLPLPDYIGLSGIDITLTGSTSAKATVDAANRQLVVTFTEATTDPNFTINILTYLKVEAGIKPIVTLDTAGKTAKTYTFNAYEKVEDIKFISDKNVWGISGDIFYNLSRALSGEQFLNITNSAFATIENQGIQLALVDPDKGITVKSYYVDVKGNPILDTEEVLVDGTDYVIIENSDKKLSVKVTNMDQEKTYVVSTSKEYALQGTTASKYTAPDKTLGRWAYGNLTYYNADSSSVLSSYYSANISNKGGKNLKNDGIAGTMTSAQLISGDKYRVNLLNKNDRFKYAVKAGDTFTITSDNGQPITDYLLSIYDANNTNVAESSFEIVPTGSENILTLRAKQDIVLSQMYVEATVPQNKEAVVLSAENTMINAGAKYEVLYNPYIEKISVINADFGGTAWGNSNAASNNSKNAKIHLEGTTAEPLNNIKITIDHPSYFSVREIQALVTSQKTYKLGVDYTIEKVSDTETIIAFTTPITNTIDYSLVFNYVPDGLDKTEPIPSGDNAVDSTVTLSADGYEDIPPVLVSSYLKEREYSEATLQSTPGKNSLAFLVNARNDSYDSLIVTSDISKMEDTAASYKIYNISNDQVKSIAHPDWTLYENSSLLTNTEVKLGDAEYPTITYDETKKVYTFDFGETSNRYLIVWERTNNWVNRSNDTIESTVTGQQEEPVSQSFQTTPATPIDTSVLEKDDTFLNVVQHTFTTKNVDANKYKLLSPSFDITLSGASKAVAETASIAIVTSSGATIPEDEYIIVPKVDGTGISIQFKEGYVLTENITLTYNSISSQSGKVSTTTSIKSDSLIGYDSYQLSKLSNSVDIEYVAGDMVTKLVSGKVLSYNTVTEEPLGNVAFILKNLDTGTEVSYTTDEAGLQALTGIRTGNYSLVVTEVPEGYTVPNEYLAGKELKIVEDTALNEFKIPLTPKENKEAVEGKDSTIYVGSTWDKEDNFVSATDKDGNTVTYTESMVDKIVDKATGEEVTTVDTSKPGVYEVTYTNGGATDTVTVTVLENKEAVEGKDSTIYVGSTWNKEDNFVSATDKDGNTVTYTESMVDKIVDKATGEEVTTVDTSKPGVYEVTYTNGGTTDTVTVTVLENKEAVEGKDSTIYVGSTWDKEDNFVSATDKDGNTVTFTESMVDKIVDKATGEEVTTVDTSKPGVYEVTYTNGGATDTVTVTVLENKETVEGKDSTIYVGSTWNKEDNFVSATDKDGNTVTFTESMVDKIVDKATGEEVTTVDTSKPGVYEVTYTNGGATDTVLVTVLGNKDIVSEKESITTEKTEEKAAVIGNKTEVKGATYEKSGSLTQKLPSTGEDISILTSILGGILLTIVLFFKGRKYKKKE